MDIQQLTTSPTEADLEARILAVGIRWQGPQTGQAA